MCAKKTHSGPYSVPYNSVPPQNPQNSTDVQLLAKNSAFPIYSALFLCYAARVALPMHRCVFLFAQLGAGMTKNGLRIPCMCYRCAGASRDWRTVQLHAKWDQADRPLFQVPVDQVHDEPMVDEQHEEDEAPSYPAVDPDIDDIVSHVESLPNCHDPMHETVSAHSLPHTLFLLNSARNTPI